MDIKELLEKRYDFSSLLNLRLYQVDSVLLEKGILFGKRSSKVFMTWENNVCLTMQIYTENADEIFKPLIGKKLEKILPPMPNHSTISVGWIFEGEEVLFLNIIGSVIWE